MGRKKKHIVIHKEQEKTSSPAETEPASGEPQKPKPKPIQNWEGEGGAVIPTGNLPPIKDVQQNK